MQTQLKKDNVNFLKFYKKLLKTPPRGSVLKSSSSSEEAVEILE